MTDTDHIRHVAPAQLKAARHVSHLAIQHLTRAARANLQAEPDDSHSNLTWMPDHRALVSQPVALPNGQRRIGVSLAGLNLFIMHDDAPEMLGTLNGLSDHDAAAMLDQRLADDGLVPSAAIALPYELPPAVASIEVYDLAPLADALAALADWYELGAAALEKIADAQRHILPGPSPVRCWPHHFDIATYLSLEDGDFETARGIGIGMSPGDESYAEPYFYVNPWPPVSPSALPQAPVPGHWHTDGFVGAIATAGEILTLEEVADGLDAFLADAVAVGRQALGC